VRPNKRHGPRSSTARRSTPPRKRNGTSRRGKPWRFLRMLHHLNSWLRRHWLLCSRSICCTIQRLACTKRRPQVQGSSAYATTRLRLCSGQQGARYARPAGLSRSPKHPAYRPLYRAIAGSFQGLLALGFRIASGHDHGRGTTQRRSIIPAVIVCMIAFVFLIGGHAPSNQVDFIIFLCVGIVVFLWWDEKRNKPKR
jgi:hypothetical protein